MGDLTKEQEQAIARSTMYLVAALLTILMVFIAGLFLSAELDQQALQKAATAQQLACQTPAIPTSSSSSRLYATSAYLPGLLLPLLAAAMSRT